MQSNQLLQALRNTLVANSTSLKETTNFLTEAAKKKGYCMSLMEIIDDSSIETAIKQAALIQLKNTIKTHWKHSQESIDEQEKAMIKNSLILAIIRCSSNDKLIKLYKEILTSVVSYEYKEWLPISSILQYIRNNESLVPVLHCLIAIATTFQFSITQEERNYFFKFLKVVFPDLTALIERNQESQIVYLCVKFLWKAVHYEINEQIKFVTTKWMPLVKAIVGIRNSTFDSQVDEFQPKGSPVFYYTHSKKWATRILLRFVQKHAKMLSITKAQKNERFSISWYESFGKDFVDVLVSQFQVPTNKKVRYFQLKCINSFINEKPDLMKGYWEYFQYNILPRYMVLQPLDEELANNDPLEFLSKQDEPSFNFTNLKRVATDVWVAFAELGGKSEKKNQAYAPGIYFYQNMNYLKQKLQGTNMIEKELAMYLICKLRFVVMRCKEVKNNIPSLIATYILPEFKSEIMFLRVRAVDVFQEYGSLNLPFDLIKNSTELIFKCLTEDPCPIVRIKAAPAFNCILKHSSSKQLVRPYLKDILTVYLQLLEKYDMESLVNSLEMIVQEFALQISPFALELGRYLSKLFVKLFNKDIEECNNQEYEGEAQLAAAACLKTLTQIIESPIDEKTTQQLQKEVIDLLQFIFSTNSMDYIQDALFLLNAYLYKINSISPKLWFYYQVVIYNMVGIPQNLWGNINSLPISEIQRQILTKIRAGGNYEMMEHSMPAIRNYISKGANGISQNRDAFQINLLQLLFYLIREIYQKGPSDFMGEIDLICCTALIVNLLENHQSNLPEPIFLSIWGIIKYNIATLKSKVIHTLNIQAIGLFLWVNTPLAMKLLSEGMLDTFFREIFTYEGKVEEEHERQRLILGFCNLLMWPQKNQSSITKLKEIFKILVKFVKKNADQRNLECNPNYNETDDIEDDNEDQDDIDLDLDNDDDEPFEEGYNDNYNSKLDAVDEIKYFLESMNKIKAEQPEFHSWLFSQLDSEEISSLESKVQKALALVEGRT